MFTNVKYDKLFKLMNENDMDAVMIAPSSDMEYLVDYHAHADERLNCLVLMKDKSYFHIAPMINYEEAKGKYPVDANFYVWADGDGFLDTVVEAFNTYGLQDKNVGVNETIRGIDVIDFQNLLNTTFLNAHPMLETYRIQKSNAEIANMKKAAEIADAVMVAMKSFIKPGMFEYQVSDEIKRLYIELGADGISFEPIVATGKNSSMPHYNDGSTQIKKGDNIVVDCGCRVNNMCSDSSRTFFMGVPSDKQRRVYEICKTSTLTAQSGAKRGMTAGAVDKLARDIIEAEGYGDCFLNRTGHGIGFSVHEAPYIKANSELILEESMAFSIEPGIYISGEFGMRVENIVIIEKGVSVSLNNSPIDIEDMIIDV